MGYFAIIVEGGSDYNESHIQEGKCKQKETDIEEMRNANRKESSSFERWNSIGKPWLCLGSTVRGY